MKFIKIICTILCFLFVNTNGMQEIPMPFRIGFEGQMEGQLCMQVLTRPAVQKKPIFELHYEGKKLWHVEFDGPDLEFVTIPFAHTEKQRVQVCMLTIQQAINDLMRLLPGSTASNIIGWFNALNIGTDGKRTKHKSDETFFSAQNLGAVQIKKISTDWKPIWRPQVTIQHPLQCAIGLYTMLFEETKTIEEIKKTIPTINPNTALAGLIFLQAHEMLGMTNSVPLAIEDMNLNFALVTALTMFFIDQKTPQAQITLDKILEVIGTPEIVGIAYECYKYIVQLYITSKGVSKEILMPQLDQQKQKIVKSFYDERCAHITGILFEARDTNPILQDILFMMNTWQSLNDVNQFDAKRFIFFMSRRPFCHMFAEIAAAPTDSLILTDQYSKTALLKERFIDVFQTSIPSIVETLQQTWMVSNYGEQFYEAVGQNPLDLSDLADFFPDPLKTQVVPLLQKGLLSTTMLRIINIGTLEAGGRLSPIAKEIITLMRDPRYFRLALESTQLPQRKTFLKISKTGKTIIDAEQLPQALDLISPPFPLDTRDAMGFHRDGVFSEDAAIFGSAIVELRNISDIQKFRTTDSVGFLTSPSNVTTELLRLFDFLTGLKIKTK